MRAKRPERLSRRIWLRNVAVGLSAVVAMTGCSSRQTTASLAGSAPSRTQAVRHAVSFAPAQAETLQKELTSGNAEQTQRAVALPVGQKLPAAVLAQLSELHVAFLPDTFHDAGQGKATVDATVANGGKTSRWHVGLINDGTAWKVSVSTLQATS